MAGRKERTTQRKASQALCSRDYRSRIACRRNKDMHVSVHGYTQMHVYNCKQNKSNVSERILTTILDIFSHHEFGLVAILHICRHKRRIPAKLAMWVDLLTDNTVKDGPDVQRLGHRVIDE